MPRPVSTGRAKGRYGQVSQPIDDGRGEGCPSAGACGGQYTANTMACVSEAIGLALMNSSGERTAARPIRNIHGPSTGSPKTV
ncbi:dihydroxy-acid dehydratase domain-containing protein, partial [Paracoccus sp. APAP_BH8]|uniref:dihydroxy-acid dehydratase domain-containing protein n=1 Tax=Paracoccus sp. APAP_BH8 TaxID=3110237 RepID=UPI003FA7A24F